MGFAADECVKTIGKATAAMIKPASSSFVGMAVVNVETSLMPGDSWSGKSTMKRRPDFSSSLKEINSGSELQNGDARNALLTRRIR